MPGPNLEKLDEFCEAWIAKAHEADTRDIAGVFDRFFALWVVYSRLYEVVARTLAFERHPCARRFMPRRNQPFAPPPDRLSATRGVVFFCGQRELAEAVAEHEGCQQTLETTLWVIESGILFLHEDYETGEPDYERDRQLVQRARNGNLNALLSLMYQARCNLFHGQKAYSEAQRPLLEGMIEVLVVVIEQIRASMWNRALPA